MADRSKTAIERENKEVEMGKLIDALENAGVKIERVNDFGTLAYMITDGELEGRFITVKVVLTKEFDEVKMTGFDMEEGISEYGMKVAKKEADEAARVAKIELKEAKAQAKADAKAAKVAAIEE